MLRRLLPLLLLATPAAVFAGSTTSAPTAPAASTSAKLDAIPRLDFNRRAAELALPLFWIKDLNNNKALDSNELAILWGMSDEPRSAFIDDKGAFTQRTLDAYAAMQKPADTSDPRKAAVLAELAQGRPTLVRTELTTDEDKAIVAAIARAAAILEKLHQKQNGVDTLKVPADDAASRMLFFRNQGPFCEAPKTEKDPNCSALASKPVKVSGMYPASIQKDGFCQVLEKRKDADALFHQFSVVTHKKGGVAKGDAATDDLEAVPYTVHYAAEMKAISAELKAASAAVKDPSEGPFKAYLDATAQAFLDNDWFKADLAWKGMSATNSKWYLRFAPDEVYFEPCSRKAGFHVSFARINQESIALQNKLNPLKKEMETALASLAGAPYVARDVGFELPEFIDIILNAGDSRSAIGATIGQSLPNWGPVAEKGGRTVAMANLYTDEDSKAAYVEQASSLYCKATMAKVKDDPKHANLSTVLHEAAHNLGPAHEYKVDGKTDDQVFGGPLASMLEELKSQTAALYFTPWLVKKKVITQAVAENAALHDVTWAFGHISQGMKNAEGKPKPYSQLAAIQMGFFAEKGALVWKEKDKAANGKDVGCFDVDAKKWGPAVDELTKLVAGIKSRGDKALAEKTRDAYVSDDVPFAKHRATITERWLRAPKASFVYSF